MTLDTDLSPEREESLLPSYNKTPCHSDGNGKKKIECFMTLFHNELSLTLLKG